jgi:hypothetical protein
MGEDTEMNLEKEAVEKWTGSSWLKIVITGRHLLIQ